jgi:predicted phosphodiesterase
MSKVEGLMKFASTQEQIDTIKAIEEMGTQKKAAKKLGISTSILAKRLARVRAKASKRGWSPDCDMTNVCPDGFSVKGTSTLYNAEGGITAQWVKVNKDTEDIKEALQAFAEELTEEVRGKYKPAGQKPKAKDKNKDLATAIIVGDAHLGLYAWGEECGGESYDLSKSREHILESVRNLIDRSVECEHGIFINVGDWFHANTKVPTTPMSGNLLDVDSRFGKVARAGAELQRECINMMLEKFPQVTVINAKGNHDPDAAVWLNMLTEAYFENEDRVEVINNSKKFLHHQWGETSLFVYHGEKNRRSQYEYVTSAYRKEFGSSEFAYVITGHIHHVTKEEMGGVQFESFGTLTAKDAYHADNLYTAARTMTAITYHKMYGEVGRQVFDIRMAS